MLLPAIEEYLDDLRARGRSLETCRQYRWQLARWWLWCETTAQLTALDQLTKPLLRRWAAGLRDHWQPATCRVAVVSVKGFLHWAVDEELLPPALAACLKTPTRPRRVQRTCTLTEFQALLAASGSDPAGIRNRALISLAFDSLLRAGEICRLDLKDIDLVRRAATVHGKGDRQEIVRFGQSTTDALRAWLAVRSSPTPALFVSVGGLHPGSRLTRDGLRTILRKLARQAGLPHLSPHALRRGGAVALLEGGAPSRLVQMHGRWDDLNMVDLYTQRLNASTLFDHYSTVDKARQPP